MRVLRRALRVLAIVLVLAVGVAGAAALVSQTAWFRNWLRGYVVAQANQYLNGQLSIGRLDGNLFTGLALQNIAVSKDGEDMVHVEKLAVNYNLYQLVTRGLSLDELQLTRPILYLRRDEAGWSIARLIKRQEQEADREGPRSPFSVGVIKIINGDVIIDGAEASETVRIPRRIEQLDAELSFAYEPVHYSIEISHFAFRASKPTLSLNELTGGVAVRDDTLFLDDVALRTEESAVTIDGAIQDYLTAAPRLNVRMASQQLSLPEFAGVIPAVKGVDVQPAFELAVDGLLDRLNIEANVRSSAGELRGTLIADLTSPGQSATGQVSVRHLNLAPILSDKRRRSDVTADLTVDLRAGQTFADTESLSGTVAVAAPRLQAAGYAADNVRARFALEGRRVDVDARADTYGAHATTRGRVTIPRAGHPVAFNLRGQVRHVDLGRMPAALKAPKTATDINADYRISGTQRFGGKSANRSPRVVLNATLHDSTVPGATIARGSTVTVDTRGAAPAYRADATVSHANLQRLGQAFRIAALATNRYESDLNVHLVAEGRGTSPRTMNVTATGTVTDSTIAGGRLENLAFDAALDRDTLRVDARGTFADLDPAVASGNPRIRGDVDGRVETIATIAEVSSGVTTKSVEATVRLALEPSTLGGLAISSGQLDADYRDELATIRQLDVHGVDANLTAHGTLALSDRGESALTFHADSPRLAEIGRLTDQPLSGIGQADGTVTGNRTALRIEGTVAGSGVKYGDNGALTVNSTVVARIPDLEFGRAAVDAETRATFVTVSGQNINELIAKTTYENRRLAFDATGKQPQRSADAAGALVLHTDHQEVHFERLVVRAANQEWIVPAGTEPRVSYAKDTISIEGLRLVNGTQAITADGTFGRPGDALAVTLRNVDLAAVDAILLRPPQFTGTLNARATIDGTRSDPRADGEFRVEQGGFRKFAYDSFGGTVQYGGPGLTVDARLQQNGTQWITAKGYVPIAAFRPGSGDRAPGHTDASSQGDRIDLAIDSSPLGLGLVQGFTTAVTDVAGTFEAHVRVTGAADDPHPTGAITIADGALTVEPTGVTYTNIAGRVDLQPDRVHIDQITVLDNHQSALSLTGDLAIHEREVGGVQLWVTAEDFKIVDNRLGNVRVQSAMELAGELRKPEIRGYFGITTGKVDLDEILAVVGTSPYSTTPIEYVTDRGQAGQAARAGQVEQAGQVASEEEEPESSVFDALRMNVHVTVPDDLVVIARNLQPSSSSFGLGALNVTLGGDLTALKDPGRRFRLVGSVNTVRGTYDFQGRRFEILRDGTVRFDGQDEWDPVLDVRTRRLIQGVEARVNVRGRLKQPDIELASTPPLEDADILSLIVFNQPVNQLGAGDQINLAQRAQSIATGALAGQIAQSIGRTLGLDTFEIEVAPESGTDAQLTIGQQLGPNLYFKVQQGIGDSAVTNLVVEYALTEWLRLQTNVAQGSSTQGSLFRRNQGSGADLIVLFTK